MKKIVTTYLQIGVMACPAISDPVKVENAVVCAIVEPSLVNRPLTNRSTGCIISLARSGKGSATIPAYQIGSIVQEKLHQ